MPRDLKSVTETVIQTFADFDVSMEVLRAYEGLSHFHIYLIPKKPVRMHTVNGFIEDLRFALGCYVVKIEAPVRGKKEVKVSILKEKREEEVYWAHHHRYLLEHKPTPLTIPVGITEEREIKLIDLAQASNFLVGGHLLTGKTNFVHGLLNSLILRHDSDTLRLLLVDPKNESFAVYKGLPHLLAEPISDTDKTVKALLWVSKEMERRYDVLDKAGSDSIDTYHQTVAKTDPKAERLPYIVVVIDEIAEVMSAHGDETEKHLCRLAILSRGVGIYMILTTASPEPRILRGILRAHISSAMCFSVGSKAASEAFVNFEGAEELIGRGSALFTAPGEFPPIEIHTGLISDSEIKDNVRLVKKRHGAVDASGIDLQTPIDYRPSIFAPDEEDELYEDAKTAVIKARKASTSFLQRTFRIGYSRAARLIDLLEERGVIGPIDGVSPREILED